MGNCLIRDNKALARNAGDESQREVEETIGTFTATDESEAKSKFDGGKSMVRLRVRRESRIVDVEPKGEVLRIKVVVTQEELKQILNYNKDFKYSSVEQLVTAMKLRRQSICEVGTNNDRMNNNWRPALESIPEDR
ncbi:uncharacterized protein LOC116137088 [Pistacia vera]|nr:uncharacterized protein LOC116137088 [Pistacia vera]